MKTVTPENATPMPSVEAMTMQTIRSMMPFEKSVA